MSFLIYLLLLVIVLLASMVLTIVITNFLSDNKRLCFFGICIFVLGCCLYIYPYIVEPVILKDYQVANLNYQKVYFDKNSEDIVLVSENRKFSLSEPIINKSSFYEIVEKLKLSSQAKIWFVESFRGFLFVKGIQTDSYYHNPSKSVVYDNDTRVFTGVGILFLVFGGVTVLTAALTSYFGLEKYHWY